MDSRIEIFECKIPTRIGFVGESRNSSFWRMTTVAKEDSVLDLVQGEDQASNVVRKPGKIKDLPMMSSIILLFHNYIVFKYCR